MSIIYKSFKLKHVRELVEEQFSQLGEEKSAQVSQGKRKIGENKYTSLRKTYGILSSGRIFPKHNYMLRIDKIKIFLLMQYIQEKLQLKAGRLQNVTITGHKFKYIPVYECGSKGIRSLFKEYQDSLLEDEGSIVFTTFCDIFKLVTMCGESKYGFSTYYIKFHHSKNIFDNVLDRVVEMDLNGSSSIGIIGFRKSPKKEWQNHYQLLT